MAEDTIFRDELPPVVRRGPGRPPGSKNKPKDSPSPPKGTAPTTPKQRKGMENSLTLFYGLGGAALESRGVTFTREKEDGAGIERVWQPSLAGRAMKLGAPAAGKELSDWISSVPFLSAILGPILGNDGFNTLARVAGLPVLMHVLQVRPDSAPMIQPLVMPLLADLFQSIKKLEKEQRAAMASFAEMGEESAEEFDAFLKGIFGGAERVLDDEPEPEPMPEPEPYTEPHLEPIEPDPVYAVSPDGYGDIDEHLGI